jgi:hypothetical protein
MFEMWFAAETDVPAGGLALAAVILFTGRDSVGLQ